MSEDCDHSIFYESCPSCSRVRITELESQLAEAVDALKDVVDAADGKGWEQLDPSFKKQRAVLAKARSQ